MWCSKLTNRHPLRRLNSTFAALLHCYSKPEWYSNRYLRSEWPEVPLHNEHWIAQISDYTDSPTWQPPKSQEVTTEETTNASRKIFPPKNCCLVDNSRTQLEMAHTQIMWSVAMRTLGIILIISSSAKNSTCTHMKDMDTWIASLDHSKLLKLELLSFLRTGTPRTA